MQRRGPLDEEPQRSERACPVCGQHALAVDEPPRIDVLGVQPYSDIVGMGDLPMPGLPGIVCLGCGTRWRDPEALERGEAEPPEQGEAGPPETAASPASDSADAPASGEPEEA